MDNPIAIVGMGLRFPQDASNPEKFWDMLVSGRSARTSVPDTRYKAESYLRSAAKVPGTTAVQHGNFLKSDIHLFDAPFFSTSPAEAACIDPQQRILMEVVYESLENAGISISDISGTRSSVFTGLFNHEYENQLSRELELEPRYKATGIATSLTANRISWFYDLRGPSINVDTACSSSLVAVYLGCESILNGKAPMSIVGGTNLILTPESTMDMENLGALSAEGISHSFDARANGYSRGEGVAAIVLKPLQKALDDHDPIRAIIRGIGSNQDGRTLDIAQPNPGAQEALIRQTYADAGISLDSTGYVEAHGTGTAVGDRIELDALSSTFKDSSTMPLYIGAVKTNIGHLEATGGLAGLIKTVLILERGIIPRNVGFESLGSDISIDESIFKIPTDNVDWSVTKCRRASVSSYGFGGTNAHAILDDAASYLRSHNLYGNHNTQKNHRDTFMTQTLRSQGCHGANLNYLFTLSAADEGGLHRWTGLLEDYLNEKKEAVEQQSFLDDLCFTLCCRRSKQNWRAHLFANSVPDLLVKLKKELKPRRALSEPRIMFCFTGQGAQWLGMGKELRRFPSFLDSLRDSAQMLTRLGADWNLLDVLFGLDETCSLSNSQYSQPVCTALQVALVDFLAALGLFPSLVIGHSSGEIAAAYSAGGLSKMSALRAAFERGQCTKTLVLKPGREAETMMSIGLPKEMALQCIEKCLGSVQGLSIACVNSPKNVTVSGRRTSVQKLEAFLRGKDIFCRMLHVDLAYHSPSMVQMASEYGSRIQDLESRPDIPHKRPDFVSSVTGKVEVLDHLSDSDYWVANLVSPVLFSDAVVNGLSKTMRKTFGMSKGDEISAIVEIGPHSAMKGPIRQILEFLPGTSGMDYASLLIRETPADASALDCVGLLECLGCHVKMHTIAESWQASGSVPRVLADLPPYPFNHNKRYLFEGRMVKNLRFPSYPYNHFIGRRVIDWNPLEPKWRQIIRIKEVPWVAHHKILGKSVYPATGVLVMAAEAVLQINDYPNQISGVGFRDIIISKALIIPDVDGVDTELFLRPVHAEKSSLMKWYDFHLCALEHGEWFEICKGSVSLAVEPEDGSHSYNVGAHMNSIDFQQWSQPPNCDVLIGTKQFYTDCADNQVNYGPAFRTLTNIYTDQKNIATAILEPYAWKKHVDHPITPHVLHPAALDTILQVPFASISMNSAIVPTLIRSFWISGSVYEPRGLCRGRKIQIQARTTMTSSRNLTAMLEARETVQGSIIVRGEMYGTAVDENSSNVSFDDSVTCFKIASRPDLRYMTNAAVEKYCSERAPRSKMDPNFGANTVLGLCIWACKSACNSLDTRSIASEQPHLLKYYEWIRSQAKSHSGPSEQEFHAGDSDMTTTNGAMPEYEFELRNLEAFWPGARLIARGVRNLERVLTGKIGALELYFEDDSAESFYRDELSITNAFDKLHIFLDLMTHKDPSLHVLEVGAGTGAATERVLSALSSEHVPGETYLRCSEYMYTDITSSFFEKARQKFAAHTHRLHFKVLDIEKEPINQGFEENSYDLIIASNTAGFSGLDIVFHDERIEEMFKESELHPRTCIMIATAQTQGLAPSIDTLQDKFQILISESSESQRILAQQIQARYVKADLQTPTIATVNCHSPQQKRGNGRKVISPIELESSSLFGVPEQQFIAARDIVSSSQQLLWVVGPNACTDGPLHALMIGASRCIQGEIDSQNLCVLDLGLKLDIDRAALSIFDTFQAMLRDREGSEPELVIQDDMLCTKRMVPASGPAFHVQAKTVQQPPHQTRIKNISKTISLTIGTPGLLDTLQFTEDDQEMPLASDELEIQVKASGVNFRDVLTALGQVDACYIGSEAAGIVSRVGENCKTLQPGDRVCGVFEASLGTYARGSSAAACRIRDNMSFSVAAALPIVFATARYCLFDVARIRTGQKVLIHSGAGGLEQACIQLSQMVQAEIFTTAGTQEKRDFLSDEYSIPSDHIFCSRDTRFKEAILEVTEDRGVDVVINSLAGESLRASWELIAANGTFIEVGKKDIYHLGFLPMWPFHKGATFSSVDLAKIYQDTPNIIGKLLQCVLDDYAAGKVSVPKPLQIWQSPGIVPMFRKLQSGKSSGKMVVEFDEGHVLPPADLEIYKVVWNHTPAPIFKADVTYVVAGGLGGLGRSIIRWMVSLNARAFLIPSRSGPSTKAARAFLKEMKNKGVHAETPKCNVSDEEMLQIAIRKAQQHMPRVCGTHGQANYAAGNAYQDALAQYLVSKGERAVALDLGNFQSIGHWETMNNSEELAKAMGARNYRSVSEAELHSVLHYYCDPTLQPWPAPEDAQIVVGLDLPSRMRRRGLEDPYWMARPMLKHLYAVDTGTHGEDARLGTETKNISLALNLPEASSLSEAAEVILDGLRGKLMRTLGIDHADADPALTMNQLGVDSLAAVEIRTWLKNVAGADIVIFEILGNLSIEACSYTAAVRSKFVNDALKPDQATTEEESN
ncbi:MAG: hypothetical protein Q9160_008302 [Pyrenula sp. 1 TL-2023]